VAVSRHCMTLDIIIDVITIYHCCPSLLLFSVDVLSCIRCTGSPFQFTVGPITDGGAHKVRAIGPGLERGEVNKPSLLPFANFSDI